MAEEEVNVAQLEYQDAKALADLGTPARVLIMAAILTDDEDAQRLCKAYPGLHAETMRRRWDSTDGSLLGDVQGTPEPERLTALGRDD